MKIGENKTHGRGQKSGLMKELKTMENRARKPVLLLAVAGTTILAFAAGQTRGESTTVRPIESTDVLHNPDEGWCLYTFGWK